MTRRYGQFVALDDATLDVKRGEFICILGPSGCGKTTLLRLIAGLDEVNAGQIIQGGVDVTRLPASRRDFGIVFQSYALFPNLTAAQNVAYGLENNRVNKAEVIHRVNELLQLVGLSDMGHKYPAQLSGGQQQRVALARALALSPGLLLLDEPLSALDARVRASLRTEITRLQRRLGLTTVMVTHDQEEALAMADRIVVMDRGRIVQVGTPIEIYRAPVTAFVADFIGVINFLPGIVDDLPGYVRCGDALLPLAQGLSDLLPGQPVTLAFRPEDVRLMDGRVESPGSLDTYIDEAEFLGPFYRLRLKVRGSNNGSTPLPLLADVFAHAARQMSLEPGSAVAVQLPPDLIRVFPHGK